jgi:ABC-type spermidine/putrescine transport system permease subunit II
MKRLNQTGSHLVVGLLAIVVVAAVSFAGYRVMVKNTGLQTSNTSSTIKHTTAAVPATITNRAGLTQAAQSLDSASADINSNVNGDSLNTDLNSLL